MIPFGIRKMSNKDGSITLHIAIDSKYLVEDGMLEKIAEIENLTNDLVKDLKQLLKKIGENKNDIELHWKIGDKLYEYLRETKKRGFVCSSLPKMLEDYMPKYRTEHWRIRLKFREEYPDKKLLDASVPFEMYHELLFFKKKDRKRLEKMMREGRIKTTMDMRAMRITTKAHRDKTASK